jgi:hypothetical protein
MDLTEAEADWVKHKRARLELEARDWSKEPVLTDRDIYTMSGEFVQRVFSLSSANWTRDDRALCFRNVTHPSNASWFAEHWRGQLASGVITAEQCEAKLSDLPKPRFSEGRPGGFGGW